MVLSSPLRDLWALADAILAHHLMWERLPFVSSSLASQGKYCPAVGSGSLLPPAALGVVDCFSTPPHQASPGCGGEEQTISLT